MVDDPVDRGDNCRGGGTAAAPEHAGGNESDVLGNAVGGASDGAGHVRAVSVAVGRTTPVADRGEARLDPAGELRVRCPDAGVDDVGGDTRARGAVGVRAVQREEPLVESVDAPRGTGLVGIKLDDGVGFDGEDIGT